MTEDRYNRLMQVVKSRKRYGILLNILDKIITVLVALIYILLILYVFFRESDRLFPMIAVPGVSFLLLSLFRANLNAPRPYEVYGVAPVLKKDTPGKSFPSRHVFSIFIIAATFHLFDATLSWVIFVLGIMLGAIRVIGGVHFIKDVVVGAVSGLICGIIGYMVIFQV